MSGADYTIRLSRDEDVPAIAAIYRHHVLHGVASFEEMPPDAAEIARRRGEIVGRGLPYLVAERAGRVIGYCYAGLFRPRVAYRFTVEDSVYVAAGQIRGYHAHIYYNPETRQVAERLREAIGNRFSVELGRWRDEPVGPHPVSMYQAAFSVAEFPRLVPWLMLNRAGLDILVHPQTDDAYHDHTIHALWLGTPLPLRVEGLRRNRERQGTP